MKLKQVLFFLSLILLINQVSGQWYYNRVQKTMWKKTMLGSGSSVEICLKQPFTLAFYGGINFSRQYVKYAKDIDKEAGLFICNYFAVQPRYYYNLERRRTKGYSWAGFSGDFVGLSLYTGLADVKTEDFRGILPYHALIPTWGIQRRFKKNSQYYYCIYAGAGIATNLRRAGFIPTYSYGGEFGWYWLSNRKK